MRRRLSSSVLSAFKKPAQLEAYIAATPPTQFNEDLTSSCLAKLAELRSKDQAALDKLLLVSKDLVFQPRELGVCLQSFGTKRLATRQLPQSLLDQVEHSLPYLKANELCDALQVLANLGQQNLPLHFFDAIAQEVVERDLFQYFQKSSLVGVIGSLARLNYVPAPVVVERFTQAVNARDVRKYLPSEVIVLLQSLSKWNAALESFLDKLVAAQVDFADPQWKPQDVAQLVLALRQCPRNPALLAKVDYAVLSKDLSKFFPDSLVAVVAEFSGGKNLQLVDKVCTELGKRDFQYLSTPQLALLGESLARLRFANSQTMLDKIAEQVKLRSSEFTSHELVRVARCFALFADKQVADDVANALTEREPLPFDELVDLAFSFAVMDSIKRSYAVQQFFGQLVGEDVVDQTLTKEEAAVVAEMLQLTKLAWSLALPKRTSQLLKGLDRGKWSETILQRSPTSASTSTTEESPIDATIYALLNDEMTDDILEYKTKVGECVMVDVLVRASKTVIEFERPTVLLSCGTKTTGEVQFRRRMMRQLGYSVFAFPTKQFGALSPAQQRKHVQDFCQRVTATASPAARLT